MHIGRLLLMLLGVSGSALAAEVLPPALAGQIPAGLTPYLVQTADFDANGLTDYLLLTIRTDEEQQTPAPARPVLVFLQRTANEFWLAGRNDQIAFRADQGGQCDPILDSGGLAAKGAYFTVENAVSCGQHWTDFISFKYHRPSQGFIFHRRVSESWQLTASNDPNAEPLTLDHKRDIKAQANKPVSLVQYRLD